MGNKMPLTSWIPTENRILIKVDESVTQTASGLTIPTDSENPRLDTGEIISIGQVPSEGLENRHAEIKVGRRAAFFKESGMPIYLTEDTENLYVVLNINDIYFVSDDEEATLRQY